MINIITELIGYAAAVVGIALMLPQVIKSIRTERVEDLSWWMLRLYFLNCALWLTYGIMISAMPVAVCNFIALIISVIQLSLKKKYSK